MRSMLDAVAFSIDSPVPGDVGLAIGFAQNAGTDAGLMQSGADGGGIVARGNRRGARRRGRFCRRMPCGPAPEMNRNAWCSGRGLRSHRNKLASASKTSSARRPRANASPRILLKIISYLRLHSRRKVPGTSTQLLRSALLATAIDSHAWSV